MNTITQLLEKWEARSRGANPCDAMLINKHIRELREAVARPQFAGFDVLALALEALELAEESLSSFVSDHGWSQRDMDNLDTVTAAIKQAQDGALIDEGTKPREPVAAVAEVHMSRYTIERVNGPVPMGTMLYAAPKGTKS